MKVNKTVKAFTVFTAVILCVGLLLTGCGNNGADSSTSDGAESESAEITADNWQNSLEGLTLSFGTAATFGPYTYFDEDGKTVIGFDIDFLEKLEELLGFEIKDDTIQTMDYAALSTSVAEGKLDMVISAFAITDERKEVMNFSDAYAESSYTVLINKESSSPKITGLDVFLDPDCKFKIACGSGTAAHLMLQDKNISDSVLDVYDNVSEALQALESGKTDAMLYDNAGASYYIKTTKGTKIEKVGDPINEGNASYGVALSNDVVEKNPNLLPAINYAIQYLKDEGYFEELTTKWVE